ncbi:ssDNA-binding domain of telomere protection protein [Ditylenchus destructor]|nr:ssDNA-binding domain of telomere protection protein [Ditylenchus destructor]
MMSETNFDEAIMRQPGYEPCATTRFTSTMAIERIKETIDATKMKHGLVKTTSFENIQPSQAGFYDCVCQIIGIFVQRNEKRKRTYFRVTDGTIPPGNTPINKAIDVDLQKSKCDTELEGMLESVLIDICCWDEFATDAMEYKLGDIVKLGNIQVKVLNCVVSFGLHGVGNAPSCVAKFGNIRGITFLERGWHPQSGSMDENMSIDALSDALSGALSDFDTGSKFVLPIADSLAGSQQIAQKEQQNSEDSESIVNDSYSEQQTSQEERNSQTLGQMVVSHLRNLSPERRRRAEAEIEEILRRCEE